MAKRFRRQDSSDGSYLRLMAIARTWLVRNLICSPGESCTRISGSSSSKTRLVSNTLP